MPDLVRCMPWPGGDPAGAVSLEPLLTREWLVANGLGGYACGTVGGVATRRLHGLLVAAFPAPLGRTVMLNHLVETITLVGGAEYVLSGEERGDTLHLPAGRLLTEFRLEDGLPVWQFAVGEAEIERRLLLPHGQNTVHLRYRVKASPGPVRLRLGPMLHFRPHDAPVSEPLDGPYVSTVSEGCYEVSAPRPLPPLRLQVHGQEPTFAVEATTWSDVYYRVEAQRGHEPRDTLWSPGHLRVEIAPGQEAILVASTEPWDVIRALPPDEALAAELNRRRRLLASAPPPARQGPAAELVIAADQFLITPPGRAEDAARARAAGGVVRTVIAGYPWFTDWGRDTMISLEGLTLCTGRSVEARYLLRTFASYTRDGLIPNLFPEGEREGLYHTADASLWYFQAVQRYLDATDDQRTLTLLLPTLRAIVAHHQRGTHFGIGVDPADRLLRQGAEGYQLTWMDAKVGDWVVTPRRGKAVEINALWYNALCLLADWLRSAGDVAEADGLVEEAARVRAAFNQRFWFAAGSYLYDVVDGEGGYADPACRPNQLLAIALDHPVLERERWESVVQIARERLLTPMGLRSLAPGHPDYKPRYHGDLHARDAAYHQGTVWAWLIGPFVDAWLKVYPDDRLGARRFLDGLVQHLGEACIGSISEIFDAEAPYTPRGCIAQAWSVAETLRCWLKTADPGEVFVGP